MTTIEHGRAHITSSVHISSKPGSGKGGFEEGLSHSKHSSLLPRSDLAGALNTAAGRLARLCHQPPGAGPLEPLPAAHPRPSPGNRL